MYIKDGEINFRRILSFLNTDLNTDTVGSFDRYYWSWKKKDIQDSTLAYAIVPLLKYNKKVPSFRNSERLEELCIRNILKMRHANNSFDQSYPYENHPKTGLDFSSVLYFYLKRRHNAEVENVYRGLIDYSLESEENYAIISNHLAHHAYEYLLAYDYFGDMRYYKKAVENILRIDSYTDPEGWHKEYFWGDPGYQTRTLRYLVKCIPFLNRDDARFCFDLCRRSCSFLDKTILPDGTLYGMFGARNTALIYPSGIEYMTLLEPEKYGMVAYRIRNSIEKNLAIQPSQLDFDNMIRLFDDFLDAEEYFEKSVRPVSAGDSFGYNLENFGLMRINKGCYSIFIHYKFGGMIAVYSGSSLQYKDAGFLIESERGDFFGTRNLQTLSKIIWKGRNAIEIKTQLFKSIHQELNPLRLVGLRLLNMTLLRNKFMADLFRNILVRTLISGSKNQPAGSMTRRIEISENSVNIRDRLKTNFRPVRIWRVISNNLFHMASSRYIHPADYFLEHAVQETFNCENEIIEISRKLRLNDK